MENKSCTISTKFVSTTKVRVWHIKNFQSLWYLRELYSPVFYFTTETYSWCYKILLCYKENKLTIKLEPMDCTHNGFLQISYIIKNEQEVRITEGKGAENILELAIKNEVLQYNSIYLEFKICYTIAKSTTSNQYLIPMEMEMEIWHQKMTKHFSELYLNSEFSDITFHVEDSVFPAHKIVLAMHSHVFAKMFATSMIEQSKGKVYISHFTAEAFNFMLRYIYTSELIDLRNIINELIFLAHMYDIKLLIKECIQFFVNNMNEENALETLIIADKLNIEDLEYACYRYISNNMKSIASKKEFDDLKEYHIDVAMKVLDWIVDFSMSSQELRQKEP